MVPCRVLSLLTALAVKHSPWAHFGSSAPFLGAAWEASLHPFPSADDYKSELREQLPLIAGSAAAGVVFIVSLVAISIVCSRWGCERGLGWEGNDGERAWAGHHSTGGGTDVWAAPWGVDWGRDAHGGICSVLLGSERTARRRCTVISCSTTALGEVSREKMGMEGGRGLCVGGEGEEQKGAK